MILFTSYGCQNVVKIKFTSQYIDIHVFQHGAANTKLYGHYLQCLGGRISTWNSVQQCMIILKGLLQEIPCILQCN